MSKEHELHMGADSMVNQVLSERRERMTIRADFADEVARGAVAAPRVRSRSRLGLPIVVIVVASGLAASTALAGIVYFIRQAQFRAAAPQISPCVECEPQTAITETGSTNRAGAQGKNDWVPEQTSQQAQAPTIRDSAGIRIVMNRARASTPIVFRLSTTPLMNVGGVERNPALEFDHNQGYLRAVQLGDGGFAVIDVARVHLFDNRGTRIKTSGTAGRGPLELLYMTAVCLTRGDTTIVTDSHNNRLALLDKDGTIFRTLARPPSAYLGFNACLGDGTFILQQSASTPGEPTKTSFLRMRTDGSHINTIGPIMGPASRTVTGSLAHAAGGDRIYLSHPEENQIRVLNPSGALIRIIRTADPLQRISADEITRRTTTSRANAARTGRPADPVATHNHAFDEIVVGSDGWLWAEENSGVASEPKTWVAFDENGAMVGKLRLFGSESAGDAPVVLGFGRGTVLLRRWDKDGATYLTQYRLERTGGEE